MALLRVFFSWFRSFSWRRSPLSRHWRRGLLSLRTSGRYSSPAASPVTFKAERCMRSCRSINQKQLLSWEQSCSRASRTRTNDASSESSSQNSLRPLTASKRGATSTEVGLGLTARPRAHASRSRRQRHRKDRITAVVIGCCASRSRLHGVLQRC